LEKNSGSTSARNNSIKFSKGVFLAFLDSDDLWGKDKLNVGLLLRMSLLALLIPFKNKNEEIFKISFVHLLVLL
jgi:glycosyltransferase involved in cell wall biosynthesis